jgi:sigma-B regulation protein RsbU (phosphoserine phosphatase)
VLGLFDQAAFDEETVALAPGDVIVAFSDGVTEALNPAGEEFTDERLLASLDAHKKKPPHEALAAMLGDLRTFCADATQSDDITVVLVRYNG